MPYRFIQPLPDGGIKQIAIEAANLMDAFTEFVFLHWDPDGPAAAVIYEGNFIVGQVLPRYSSARGDMEAVFEAI
ncbi:hypothetical protein OJF2_51550 [Aquisphaera giovannonii]|uniref:Uncharacterized protein n=1 Tax=Aquisphaera giovannonii TaxID=406548 RepID=A0A5B9W952_9BACT|nr:hypothetical protein [Aquisphaera giovannonii]QEH36571.1 hypothetical protein OJF2_51550 [Aquisphaera giovannonii]